MNGRTVSGRVVAGRRGLLALPLAGCAVEPPRYVAGHGVDDGGIGGTGVLGAAHGGDEGGIGGTGILGTVTGRQDGRLAVNGLLLPAGEGFAPGDTVLARLESSGAVAELDLFVPITGRLLVATGGYAVAGTPVLVDADTVLAGGAARPEPGRTYAVCGIWRDGVVVATALRPADPSRVVVRGQVRDLPGGGVGVGYTRLDPATLPMTLLPESFATVAGWPGPNGLRVERVAAGLPAVLRGRSLLAFEGFVAPNAATPGFHLSGFGLPLDPDSRVGPRAGGRRLLLGALRVGGFRATAAVPLPETAAARAAVLAGPETLATLAAWRGGTG